MKPSLLNELPIKLPANNQNDTRINKKLLSLVDKMINSYKKFIEAKDSYTKEHLNRSINTTDKKIDQLVYELYGLTEEEIKVVEEGVGVKG